MTIEELNERAEKVFILLEGDIVQEIYVDNDVTHVIIKNEDEITDYQPDMTERPQALAYLKGERDDFND